MCPLQTFSAQPVLGVEFKTEQKAAPISELTVQQRYRWHTCLASSHLHSSASRCVASSHVYNTALQATASRVWLSRPARHLAQQATPPCREDDVEVVDSGRNHFAVYAGVDSAGQQRGIVFNEELGLAMEALPEGVSLQQLSDV